MSSTIEALDAIMTLMRKHGATEVSFRDPTDAMLTTVKLGPTEPEPSDIPKALSRDALGPDKCGCGHSVLEHNEHGECTQGCDAVKCGQKP